MLFPRKLVNGRVVFESSVRSGLCLGCGSLEDILHLSQPSLMGIKTVIMSVQLRCFCEKLAFLFEQPRDAAVSTGYCHTLDGTSWW